MRVGYWVKIRKINDAINQTLLKCVGEAADIAKAVKFLVADAPFITGHVGGGWWEKFKSLKMFNTCYINVVESPRTCFVLLAGYLTPKLHRSLTDTLTLTTL